MPPAPVYDGDPRRDKGTSTLATIWAVTGVAILFTTGRLYVRGYMQRRLRSDDYLTIFSVVNSIVACGLATKAVSRGLGKHLDTLSPDDQAAATVWTFAAFFPGLVSFACPKLAVIALLVRLLLPSRPHFWFLWFMGVAVQLAQVGTMGLLVGDLVEKCKLFDSVHSPKPRGHCIPMRIQVRYYLFAGCASSPGPFEPLPAALCLAISRLRSSRRGRLSDRPASAIINATLALSAFADFYLAAYPSIVLYHLQMPGRKKLALSIALGFGVVSGAVATYKTSHIPLLLDPDFTYANAELQLWTLVEGGIIVIASSIPILQPLIDKLFGARIMGRSRSFVTKHKAIFSDRRKIATIIRLRIKENQGTTTTTTNFTTMTTRPEELTVVHRLDSGTDGMAYNYPCHSANVDDGNHHIGGSPRPGVVVENSFPKE
ncbi:mitochondrial protein [Apiospora arundinis]|uniref:Integral membrane protein n=1 Tax=Apiospora arundinis TaxID=335852 RepID=A0ABR2IW30_9PEZI